MLFLNLALTIEYVVISLFFLLGTQPRSDGRVCSVVVGLPPRALERRAAT
jgi:hypothetical protein